MEEDWAMLKELRRGPSPTIPMEGVDEAWRDIKGIPDYVYFPVKGVGIGSMGLWRLIPKARRHGPMPGCGSRIVEFWTATHDKLLWAGPTYSQAKGEVEGKRYSYRRKSLCLTLDEAFKRLEAYRDEHTRDALAYIAQTEQTVENYLRSIADSRARIAQGSALVFDESLLTSR